MSLKWEEVGEKNWMAAAVGHAIIIIKKVLFSDADCYFFFFY